MREYGTVKGTFWTRGSGKKLRGDPEAQVLALYLMTCSSVSMTGIYYMPMVIMAHDTGLGAAETERCLARLADPEVDIAHYDPEAELVWVPNLSTHQVGDSLKYGDKRRISLMNELARHAQHRFAAMFWDRYGDAYSLDANDRSHAEPLFNHLTPSQGASKGHTKGSLPRERVGGDQEQEQEQHQDHIRPDAPSVGHAGGLTPEQVRAAKSVAVPPPGRGRRARSTMKHGWQPNATAIAALEKQGLSPQAVIDDFRDYWLSNGKAMVDWDACFRNRIRQIEREEWLVAKFKAVAPPASSRERPPTNYGPPAPPPTDLVARIGRFAAPRQTTTPDPDPADPPDPTAAATGGGR